MQPAESLNVISLLQRRMPSSVVVFAAGTGGPQALAEILPRFPAAFSGAIVILQQMRTGFTKVLAEHLDQVCQLPVTEAADGESFHAAEALVVPAGFHLSLAQSSDGRTATVRLDDVRNDPDALRQRADQTMASLARVYERDAIGVLLTGTGQDGCEGIRAIADAGGVTIAQDEESSIVFDLPNSAITASVVHQVLPLWSIADHILMIEREANASAA